MCDWWCKAGGCVGKERECDGICYCFGVSKRIYHIANRVFN